jgi:hypothetical protein
MKLSKKLMVSIVLCYLVQNGLAQKLPNVQKINVLVPKGIEIDGKPAEWKNFKAYNNAIECFYTISNDDQNLYLVIHATNHSIIHKIVAGGITFTLNRAKIKNDSSQFTITYPYIPPKIDVGGTSYTLRSNEFLTEIQLKELNQKVSGSVKEIPIKGLNVITDNSISIYNDLGIKAAGLIDLNKTYTSEIAIPLKYLASIFNHNGSFDYQIQVNGLNTIGKKEFVVVTGNANNKSGAPISQTPINPMFSPTFVKGNSALIK